MYLGIDIGTSSVKALVMDGEGRAVADASAPLSVDRPRDGWSEQDPADWLAAVDGAMAALARDHRRVMEGVLAIGLSGQMHGATLLGAEDRPLRPCILWNDSRAAEEAAGLDADPAFRRITGNVVFPGFTAPKLVWVAKNEPDVFVKTRKILLPKDYVRLFLTGETVSDMSDAAGTAWLDMRRRTYSPPLLDACRLSTEHLPRLAEGTDVTGTLRDALAARWGLRPGIVVAGGAGDNAASACGVGVVAEGDGFVSLGTSGVVFTAGRVFRPRPEAAVHAFCHALPGRWHEMGVILSAAACLDWLSGVLGRPAGELVAALPAEPGAPRPLAFLPYLSGERTPHNNAGIRAAFVGLGHADGAADLTRAVLEGVAFAIADACDALRTGGAAPQRLMAVGGGSRSDLWLSLIATVLGIPIDRPEEGDRGAAYGAARLALIAATGADPDDVCRPPPIAKTFAPVRELEPAYGEALAAWRRLYPALRRGQD